MRRKEGPSFLLKFLPNPPNWPPEPLILSSPEPLILSSLDFYKIVKLLSCPITKFYAWLPETVQNSIKFYGIRLKYGSPAIKFYESLLLLLLPQLLPNPPNPGFPASWLHGFMAYCTFYDTPPCLILTLDFCAANAGFLHCKHLFTLFYTLYDTIIILSF